MDRFNCAGKLNITVNPSIHDAVCVKLTHHCPHEYYVDIGSKRVEDIIQDMKDSPPSVIWQRILKEEPKTTLTKEQIYIRWSRMNMDNWRLADDQVKSAIKLLETVDGVGVEIIPIKKEDGIHAIGFSMKEALDEYGQDVRELAMDSTWKTNAVGYELYGIVAEANGRSLPVAFVFVTTDGSALSGAKDRMLQQVLGHLKNKCPNILFTLSDKDQSEINACRAIFPQARHQLCYWHAIRYIEERLAEDKIPAPYDPLKAHRIFDFIDPTWAPGVTVPEPLSTQVAQSTPLAPVLVSIVSFFLANNLIYFFHRRHPYLLSSGGDMARKQFLYIHSLRRSRRLICLSFALWKIALEL
ncbi:hypothetical protein M422DRAFT_184438 [Sphaerobolus stellatus SS14]|uniref:MULE transposase domain-containing protein n=1 Tax=Sphaerobolus stellatus (strain SS14) TaxID=990650 RepID=A0A0C9V4S6_SPHS4|nr:hypothetical protein M422DRAFT_186716 [Sphaerobolus stellatus SS14]KIJ32465.1 hypothetical protein M422DRAFT_184438 [Sphaerobolus stellatus SS14]